MTHDLLYFLHAFCFIPIQCLKPASTRMVIRTLNLHAD
uniref:Uncharacterized protein n=1 Tax=Triticum urartu TaxID=4572 RepID=A0A8R7PCL8_TRIUA